MDKNKLNAIIYAVITTIDAAGSTGMPSGHLYAALMTHGVTLDWYQRLIATLKNSGLIDTPSTHLLVLTSKGREFSTKLEAAVR